MKKLLSVLLTLSLVAGLATTAFAETSANGRSNALSKRDLAYCYLSEEALISARLAQENIVIIDEDDDVLAEYHTDGYVAEFSYDSENLSDDGRKVLRQIKDNNNVRVVLNGRIHKIYANDVLVETRNYAPLVAAPIDQFDQPGVVKSSTVYTDFYVYHSDGTKSKMNNILTNAQFLRNSNSASQAAIQTLFNNNNSPLKNNITVYKKNDSGALVSYGTVTPAKVIYDASVLYVVNPKLILLTLQKESSLVSAYHTTAGTPLTSRVFWFCMGAGYETSTTTTGFSNQIVEGTRILKYWYNDKNGTSTAFYYSHTGFRGYHGYNTSGYDTGIWCDNAATYSLYKYTPYTCVNNTNTKESGNVFVLRYKGATWLGTLSW